MSLTTCSIPQNLGSARGRQAAFLSAQFVDTANTAHGSPVAFTELVVGSGNYSGVGSVDPAWGPGRFEFIWTGSPAISSSLDPFPVNYFPITGTVTLSASEHTAISADVLANPTHKIVTDATGEVEIDLSQAIPNVQNTGTVGNSLLASEVQGFGKWVLSNNGLTLTLYRQDGVTPERIFNLDNAAAPTVRS